MRLFNPQIFGGFPKYMRFMKYTNQVVFRNHYINVTMSAIIEQN